MNYDDIGRRIRARRKALGISQEQLAEEADISITHMSHIETGGTKLSLPVLVKLANALSCGTDALLSGTLERCEPAIHKDIASLLDGCDAAQLRVISDIIQAAKVSMDKNL